MNLHGLASGITAVNRNTQAVLRHSTGSTTAPGGRRTPTFEEVLGQVQVQGLSAKELAHLNGLNITGVLRKVYVRGAINSVLRASGKGGDVLSFEGFDWLVVHVFETWPGWSAVAVSQQVPA